MGKDPVSGLYTEAFTFGARSFSIWDVGGQLMYDSGDALERVTAEALSIQLQRFEY
jgi:5'-nucleotidase